MGETLVIGAPNALVGGEKAGKVYYRDGGWRGIFTFANQTIRIHQDSPGIPGAAEAGDGFGFSVAIGRFGHFETVDCSGGFADLCFGCHDVIAGAPFEVLNGEADGGMANIIDPSNPFCDLNDDCPGMLTQLHQDDGLEGTAEEGDAFGYALAVGDFNNDGADDLAVGVPGEAVNANLATGAGGVNIIMGDNGVGLQSFFDEFISQTSVAGAARDDENFGFSLATGDFDGDGVDDLAVGVPGDEQTDGANRTGGAINVVYGSPRIPPLFGGLTTSRTDLYHQDSSGIPGASEDGDRFGFALAAGDFNGDGADDLAIGVPAEDISNTTNAGAVTIMYGTPSNPAGLTGTNSHSIHQNTSGVDGVSEAGDEFGYALAVGDFNNDGVDDLAVGIPREDIVSVVDAGAVQVFFGVQNGRLNGVNNDVFFFHANLAVPGVATANTRFGHALAVADFDVNGKDDLAVGTGGDMITSNAFNGSVSVIYQRPEPEDDLIFANGFD